MSEENKKDEVFEVKLVDDSKLAMSNILISSKYKASLIELKTTYLALQQVQMHKYRRDEHGMLNVDLYAKDLQGEFDVRGNSFFERLSNACEHMTGRTIGFVDPENHRFSFVPFITKAEYDGGKLTIRFVPEMEKYILNINKNFTYLIKDTMMDFKSEYAFKLYEVLKSYSFYPKDYSLPKHGKFNVEIGLSELKLTMGVVNAELDAVKDVLNKTREAPDYDLAVEKSPERVYDDWRNFRRVVLDKAITEINETTDIEVTYEPVRRGRKIVGIKFLVWDKQYEKDEKPAVILNKEEWSTSAAISDEDKFIAISATLSLLNEVMEHASYTDAVTLLDETNYDVEYIGEKIEIFKSQKHDANMNVMGWLITACRENFKPAKPKEVSKAKKRSSEFDERKHDEEYFNELEKKLLQD